MVTIVPNGSDRWAHDPEPAWLSYQLAEPLWRTDPPPVDTGAAGGRCVPDGLVPRRRTWVVGAWTTSSRTTVHWTIWPSFFTTLEKTWEMPLRPAWTVAR